MRHKKRWKLTEVLMMTVLEMCWDAGVLKDFYGDFYEK